jgi:hypothetical protein
MSVLDEEKSNISSIVKKMPWFCQRLESTWTENGLFLAYIQS